MGIDFVLPAQFRVGSNDHMALKNGPCPNPGIPFDDTEGTDDDAVIQDGLRADYGERMNSGTHVASLFWRSINMI
jgi:hypothetical protein